MTLKSRLEQGFAANDSKPGEMEDLLLEAAETMAFALRQINHALLFLEPVEEAGDLPQGLATLNGLREAAKRLT